MKLRRKKSFTLIELMIVIAIIAIIAAIAIPNLIEARKSGNEAAAIGALKTIGSAQLIFSNNDKEGDGFSDYGTRQELGDQGLVDSVLGAGSKQGYAFAGTYGTLSSEFLWYGTANPSVVGTTGDRYFLTNHEGVTFYSTDSNLGLDSNSCSVPSQAIVIGK